MTDWTAIAQRTIAAVDAELAPGTPLAERIKAIDAAYPFGQRAYSPYKTWLRERRRYLVQHGYVPRTPPKDTTTGRLL